MLPAIIFALLVLTLLFGWHGLLAGLGLTAAATGANADRRAWLHAEVSVAR